MRTPPGRKNRDKRRWDRWTAHVPLEVCSDPGDRSTPWSATLQNASEGGIAFWSKQGLSAGQTVH
ncbi:MAG: hypothetical protein ACYS7M_09265, partial [Planctomycetota bacterium]